MSARIPHHKMLSFAAIATLSVLALSGCSTSDTSASTPTGTTSTTSAAATAASNGPDTASPSPAASSASPPEEAAKAEAPKLKTHSIAKGHFELTTPADWILKEEKLESWQQDSNVATSLRILNGQGLEMAAFMSGGAGPTSLSLMDEGARYTQLDSAKPKLTAPSFYSFEALGKTGEMASINLNFTDLSESTTLSHLESLIIHDDNYGYFGREISKDEKLDGVPASAQGMERLKAYAKTDEYGQIKAMMLSLQRTKKSAPTTAEAGNGGQCVGALYSYDLAGSGMSCTEAKSFVQKLADSRPSAGSVEILGHGACELPSPGRAGRCIVEETGATFNYAMKQ